MCTPNQRCDSSPLTFETMLTDPMIRLMMESDGVSLAEFTGLLHQTQVAVSRHASHHFSAAR